MWLLLIPPPIKALSEGLVLMEIKRAGKVRVTIILRELINLRRKDNIAIDNILSYCYNSRILWIMS
jgi:hypothetical protein